MAPSPVTARRLRVATYNIHRGRGLDGRLRPARIAAVLGELGADVVGLQEVLCVAGRGRADDQPRFLADALGYEMQFGAVRDIPGGRYGNLVLSALPLRPGRLYDLSVRGREERGCLRADVDLGGGRSLHVFNVHLGTSFTERRQQGPRLLEAVVRDSAELVGPRVVLGDFNEWARGAVSRLLSSRFQSVDLKAHLRWRRTYPGLLPFLHLDHIYHDDGLRLVRLALHRTRRALVASDHLPLVADFELREASRASAAAGG
jgi:endonuclease/exonuclease/phosphatase family metal-dependent hydrolase